MAVKAPVNIRFDDNIFDIDVHPSSNIVITGMINGQVQCHQYGVESNSHLWTESVFKKSCRGVRFTQDGSNIYAISRDRSIRLLDTETGKEIKMREKTHEAPLNSLLTIDHHMMATGDDQGVIKIWDNRKEEAVMTYTEHEDYIADMTYSYKHKSLLAVGGDGYLSVWDIRKPNVVAMSDQMEDELLSIELIKNEKKAIVGTQDGILTLWSWGDWGDYNDRIVGHPKSIDALCKLDEDTVCTGSSDGIIRLITVLPNEFHGMLGDHGENMPIENIRLSHDKQFLISSGHDDQLHFWNVSHLFDEEAKEEEEKVEEKEIEEEKAESESDGWGTDSDDEKTKKRKKKQIKAKQKKMSKPESKQNVQTTSFFSDL